MTLAPSFPCFSPYFLELRRGKVGRSSKLDLKVLLFAFYGYLHGCMALLLFLLYLFQQDMHSEKANRE